MINMITGQANSTYTGLNAGSEEQIQKSGASAFDKIYEEVSAKKQETSAGDTLSGELSMSALSASLNDISGMIKEDTKLVEDTLKSLYERLGIDENTSITLKTNPYTGKIEVESDELDDDMVARIEEELNGDKDFSDHFKRLSANTSLMEAMQKHMEFSQAYEMDPEAAIKQYGYLLNDNTNSIFSLIFNGSAASTKIDRVVSV